MSPSDHDPHIQPAAFAPPGSQKKVRRHAKLRPLPVLVAAVLLIFAGCAWFLFTAQAVTVRFDPSADSVNINGGLSLPLAGRHLMRPGKYSVVANKKGYEQFEGPMQVRVGDNPPFTFKLKKLPGRLQVQSKPAAATVLIDGKEIGTTPLQPVKLSPGEHEIMVRARRYEVFQTKLEIAGKDELQKLDVQLKPAWAAITVKSEPAGAIFKVDGAARGKTPVTEDIGAGSHSLSLELDGYQPWSSDLKVVAQQDKTLPTVKLEKARGKLRVSSTPAGASVTTDGKFRGHTPLTLALTPSHDTKVRFSKAGYTSATRSAEVASGQQAELSVELQAILGKVKVRATPSDARLIVDGADRGVANQTLSLTATAHKIEIRKAGYNSYNTTVTPKPGLQKTVSAELLTPAQAKAASIPKVIKTSNGQRLRLIQPGSFTMGAPRREQGRQANETEKRVTLTRSFYLATTETTNKQFRAFRSSHSSGIVQRTTLDNDNYPVVRVSWKDAVAYCNWLSKRDGLPAAYAGGQLITPVTTGYRLPTEAEWAWAARFAGGRHLKYPWGASMPPTSKSGNFADVSAAPLVAEHLSTYSDGYKAAAPVGHFAANKLGIYDMGGNAAEWVNDLYSTSLQSIGRTETDPLGPSSGSTHSIRGSSWRDGRITELRLSYRNFGSGPRDDLGFRIARYAE